MDSHISAKLRLFSATIIIGLSFLVLSLGLGNLSANATDHEVDANDRAIIEGIVRDYILDNPEVVRDALIELERRGQVAEAELQQQAIKQYSDQLLRSPSDFVAGNPDGDVTMVEFFDYNCGFCRRALADMNQLLENDPNLRVVLKEFPVLGQGSFEAAKISAAVLRQEKYLEFHRAIYAIRGGVNAANAMEVAETLGLDMERLKRDSDSPETLAIISANVEMATALGINGTPSYVIGGQLVVGAVGYEELKSRIEAERAQMNSNNSD